MTRIAQWDGEALLSDDQVGLAIAAVDRNGLAARTLVVLTPANDDREEAFLDLPEDLGGGLRALGYLEEEEPTTPPPTAP